MKLYIENEGENFEMEAKAAYVVLIDPADNDTDVTLMTMGRTRPVTLVSGIAKTLDSLLQSLTNGDREDQRRLWKIFKKEYKNARLTSTCKVERDEFRPVREED